MYVYIQHTHLIYTVQYLLNHVHIQYTYNHINSNTYKYTLQLHAFTLYSTMKRNSNNQIILTRNKEKVNGERRGRKDREERR